MRELRERVLKAFEDLEDGKIDVPQAMAFSKLNQTVVDGLKSEMQYAALTGSVPSIPFYERPDNVLIEVKSTKKLT
jgi:hypothetical protein